MKRSGLRVLLSLSVILGSLSLVPSVALADVRCSGNPGVVVHEDINQGGREAYMCGRGWANSDFYYWRDNLWTWESWDNRISSYEVFNFTGRTVTFSSNPNNVAPHLITNGTSHEYVDDLRNYNRNDVFSSATIT
jgi:hypothetical protein